MSRPVPPALESGPIYLDHNATTPVDPRVADVAWQYLAVDFGNPSSGHAYGTRPRLAVDLAREQVAGLIDAPIDSIVFTGSGSEANALAFHGVLAAAESSRRHVITQTTEHPAVLETCRALAERGRIRLTVLPVDREGILDPAQVADAIASDTVLVSVMHANNETGTVQPIADLAQITRARGVLLHTDAAQTAGKIPVSVADLGVDLLTVVGHKMYAPKGIGALYVRPGTVLRPLIDGGGQERGLRSGTENVAGIAALGSAAELARTDLDADGVRRLTAVRDALHRELEKRLGDDVRLNGHPVDRLPGTLNVSLADVDGNTLLTAVADRVAASAGSACHSGETRPSPVLLAMGVPPDAARAAVRLSVGRWTTEEQAARAAAVIAEAVTSAGATRSLR